MNAILVRVVWFRKLVRFNNLMHNRYVSLDNTHKSMPSLRRDLTSLPNDSAINISESCVQRLRSVCDINTQYLRIEVEGGGCSGFTYKFDLTDEIREDDRVFEREGVRVVIDDTSLQYLNGSTVDYNEELIKSSFRVINNPQSDHGCSCGASFSVKF